MKEVIARLFEEILAEISTNAAFRSRLEAALDSGVSPMRQPAPRRGGPRRNRRTPGVLDPYQEYVRGEEHLRVRLSTLSVEQLKDIVSEHGLDSSRLALKWKDRERLIKLIVDTVRARLEKGDAFRR